MYIAGTRKITYSYDVVFGDIFSSTLAYISQPYSESMAMCTSVSYTPYAKYPREKTGNIIKFAQFEEGDLLSDNHNLSS